MLENSVEGIVKVKILIDIDGKVKKATVINDLGFGSAQMALDACYQSAFEPARRDTLPVAVWDIISIEFRLLG